MGSRSVAVFTLECWLAGWLREFAATYVTYLGRLIDARAMCRQGLDVAVAGTGLVPAPGPSGTHATHRQLETSLATR